VYADPSFFDIFSFKLLRGERSDVLKAPNQVVVTESTAKRYFANEDPVGKVLKVDTDTTLYQVTGVIQDCPSNSQIKFDFLSSWSSLGLADEEKSYWDAKKYWDDRPHVFIALGCVLRGDTPHFDYVCKGVTDGVLQLNLSLPIPTIFGVLTVDNQQQADERIGGKHGNKGEESAMTALKMLALQQSFCNKKPA